jgi:hypothetical protein
MKLFFSSRFYITLFVLMFFNVSAFSSDVKTNNFLKEETLLQDNTVLIKKIKKRIAALKSQRQRLKTLEKWTDDREKSYLQQVDKLKKGLKKLGYSQESKLSTKEKIKRLQKELKYLNNNKTNQKVRDNWSNKDELAYQKKAGVLIDSVIKLKMVKN